MNIYTVYRSNWLIAATIVLAILAASMAATYRWIYPWEGFIPIVIVVLGLTTIPAGLLLVRLVEATLRVK